MSELSSLGVHHACLTGDCPHESMEECWKAITEYVQDLCGEVDRLEADRRALIEFSTDFYRGAVAGCIIMTVVLVLMILGLYF